MNYHCNAFLQLLLSLYVVTIAEALRRVSIDRVSDSAFITSLPVQSDFPTETVQPHRIMITTDSPLRINSDAKVVRTQYRTHTDSAEQEVRIVPTTQKRRKKKKLRKQLKRQKKTWKRFRTTQAPAITDITSASGNQLVYDNTSGTSYQAEELKQLCAETKRIGRQFAIKDLSNFAQNNCPLIRLYYPNVTCEQITVFIKFCETSGALNNE